jgi:hypothetical protein
MTTDINFLQGVRLIPAVAVPGRCPRCGGPLSQGDFAAGCLNCGYQDYLAADIPGDDMADSYKELEAKSATRAEV